MRLGFSATTLQSGKTGIARYTIRLLDALRKMPEAPAVDLIAQQPEAHLLPDGRPDWTIHVKSRKTCGAIWDVAWHQWGLARLARRRRWDIVHVPTLRRIPGRCPCPVVATVHDLAAFRVWHKYDPLRMIYHHYVLPRLLHKVQHIITPSNATKLDLMALLSVPAEKISVISLGLDSDQFRPGPQDLARQALLPELRLPSEFLLYVARLEHPGKNHVRLIEALAELQRTAGIDIPLVLAGAPWQGAEVIYDAVRRFGLDKRVIFAGFVPDEKLADLYRASTALVFPSLFEGFGFPPLEAMACGRPVVCSTGGSLPEVVGDAAEFVDANSVSDIARGLETVLCSASRRDDLICRGHRRANQFNWQATAQETLEVYRRVARTAGSH